MFAYCQTRPAPGLLSIILAVAENELTEVISSHSSKYALAYFAPHHRSISASLSNFAIRITDRVLLPIISVSSESSVLEGRVGSGQNIFSPTTDLAWSAFLQADRPLTRPLHDP